MQAPATDLAFASASAQFPASYFRACTGPAPSRPPLARQTSPNTGLRRTSKPQSQQATQLSALRQTGMAGEAGSSTPPSKALEQTHGLRDYYRVLAANRQFRFLWFAEMIDNIGSWLVRRRHGGHGSVPAV